MNTSKPQSGFTLLELMVGLALTVAAMSVAFSLYLSFNRAVIRSQGKSQFRLESELFSDVIRRQVMGGRGLLKVSEHQLELLTAEGRRMRYAFENDSLTVNGKSLPAGIRDFTIQAYGPVIYSREEFGPPAYPLSMYASLDSDGDGLLDLSELDKDGSGALERGECANIGLLKITMVYEEGADTSFQVVQVHPRNRISFSRGREEENF